MWKKMFMGDTDTNEDDLSLDIIADMDDDVSEREVNITVSLRFNSDGQVGRAAML